MADIDGAYWYAGVTTFRHQQEIEKAVGDDITVSGVTPGDYDGTLQVISCGTTSCSVLMDDPGTYVSGGEIS